MPVVVHVPASIISAAWIANGSDAVGAVATNDGDTSFLSQSFGLSDNLYNMPDLPADAATINSVSESGVIRRTAAVGLNEISFYANGTSFIGSFGPGLSYATQSVGWAATTPAAVNAAASGVRGFDTAGAENRVTHLYRTVDYNLGGGIMVMLFDLLIPIVGAGLTLAELAAFNAGLRPAGHWLRGDELAPAHAEWSALKHPSFFFLEGGLA